MTRSWTLINSSVHVDAFRHLKKSIKVKSREVIAVWNEHVYFVTNRDISEQFSYILVV